MGWRINIRHGVRKRPTYQRASHWKAADSATGICEICRRPTEYHKSVRQLGSRTCPVSYQCAPIALWDICWSRPAATHWPYARIRTFEGERRDLRPRLASHLRDMMRCLQSRLLLARRPLTCRHPIRYYRPSVRLPVSFTKSAPALYRPVLCSGLHPQSSDGVQSLYPPEFARLPQEAAGGHGEPARSLRHDYPRHQF